MERRDRGQRHHRIERGQQAAHPAFVKSRKGETAALQFGLDNPRDQIARDHEEDIDADKAAEHRRRLEMKRDHRQHGDGAQPVDIFAVVAPHDCYAAEARLQKWRRAGHRMRRVRIMSRVRPS